MSDVVAKRETAAVLSHRERHVLRLAAQGRSDAEIAKRLYLTTSTVNKHLTSAFAKLATGSRIEAERLWQPAWLSRDSGGRDCGSRRR